MTLEIPAQTLTVTIKLPMQITVPATQATLVINYEALAQALAPFLIDAIPAASADS